MEWLRCVCVLPSHCSFYLVLVQFVISSNWLPCHSLPQVLLVGQDLVGWGLGGLLLPSPPVSPQEAVWVQVHHTVYTPLHSHLAPTHYSTAESEQACVGKCTLWIENILSKRHQEKSSYCEQCADTVSVMRFSGFLSASRLGQQRYPCSKSFS